MKSLSEKVIVIMGASSGIGEATARLLARKGAKLVIAARRQERLIAIKKELPEATILVQQADVTKEEEVQHVIKLTMEKYGRIDVLFNNAGVMPTAPLIEAPKGEWRQMLDINIMGVLNGIAAVLPIMVEQNQGRLLLLILWQDMSFIQIRLSTVEQSLLFEQLWKDCDKNKERITLNQRLFHQVLYKQNFIKQFLIE